AVHGGFALSAGSVRGRLAGVSGARGATSSGRGRTDRAIPHRVTPGQTQVVVETGCSAAAGAEAQSVAALTRRRRRTAPAPGPVGALLARVHHGRVRGGAKR